MRSLYFKEEKKKQSKYGQELSQQFGCTYMQVTVILEKRFLFDLRRAITKTGEVQRTQNFKSQVSKTIPLFSCPDNSRGKKKQTPLKNQAICNN